MCHNILVLGIKFLPDFNINNVCLKYKSTKYNVEKQEQLETTFSFMSSKSLNTVSRRRFSGKLSNNGMCDSILSLLHSDVKPTIHSFNHTKHNTTK